MLLAIIFFSLYSTFRVMYQDITYECFIWAFLLRSRRATGYAIASVRCTMLTHALRMPNAKEVFFMCVMYIYAQASA